GVKLNHQVGAPQVGWPNDGSVVPGDVAGEPPRRTHCWGIQSERAWRDARALYENGALADGRCRSDDRISQANKEADEIRMSVEWRATEGSALGISANGAQTENGGDFVAIGRLEADGDLLFALHEICGNWILGVEETDRPAFFDRLLADFFALDENIE